MRDFLLSARDGFCDAFRAAWAITKTFAVWLPCILLFALPAIAAGYAWGWIVGGFRLGWALHDQRGSLAETWRMEFPEPSND